MAFAASRARVQAGLLTALALLTGALVASLGIMDAASTQALDAGVATIVADAGPTARAVRVDAPLAVDAQAQAARFGAAIDDAFAGAPVTVTRTLTGTAAAGEGAELLLIADPSVPARATLTDGAWPVADGEVAVLARAAERLGLGVGDTVGVAGAPASVVGLWQASDPADPAWFGEPAVGSGADGDAVGPVLGTEPWLADAASGARAQWTVTPAAPVGAATAPSYDRALRRLREALPALDPGGGLGVRITGDLAATLDRASGAVATARGVLLVPLLLLVVLGGIVVGVLAAALAAARRGELQLLRARGASVADLLVGAGREAVIATAMGAVGGAGIALVAGAAPVFVAIAVAGAVVGGSVIAVVAAAAALAGPEEPRSDAGRASARAIVVPLVLAVAVAGIAVAQLLAHGISPGGVIDPVAASAPALTLVAGCLLVSLAAGPVAHVGEAIARRGRGLPAVLAYRRLSRQAGALTAGVLSLALAASAAVFGGVLAGTVTGQHDADVAAVVADDLRAVFDVEPIVDAGHAGVDAEPVRRADGVAAAFPALDRPVAIGDQTPQLVAAPAAVLAELPPAAAQSAALRALRSGAAPTVTGRFDVAVTAQTQGEDPGADPQVVTVEAIAWTADADGVAHRIPLGSVAADGAVHSVGADAVDGSELLAVEVSGTGLAGRARTAVAVTATDAGGSNPVADADVVLDTSHRSVRIDAVRDLPDALPAVVTTALAKRLSAAVGTELALQLGSVSRPVPVQVTAVADSLPGLGAAPGVVVDLSALMARTVQLGGSVPTANELWIRAPDTAAASAAVRGVATDPVRFVTPATIGVAPVASPVAAVSGGGIAAVAVLAAAGFAVVSAAVVRRRLRERVPLRSFGLTVALSRRATVIEISSAAVFALAAGVGVGVGAVAAWLLLSALAGVIR